MAGPDRAERRTQNAQLEAAIEVLRQSPTGRLVSRECSYRSRAAHVDHRLRLAELKRARGLPGADGKGQTVQELSVSHRVALRIGEHYTEIAGAGDEDDVGADRPARCRSALRRVAS